MNKPMNKIEKLIAELCPEGVVFKELGELGIFYGGLTGKSKEDFSNGNAKFVTYMNVFSNIVVNTAIDNFVKISSEENQREIQYGDVLFTGSSETPDECGMSSVLTERVDDPLYLNSFCFGFRLYDTSLFLPDFLKYLFRDSQIRKKISKTASGVTRFNISKKRFGKIIIPIPPVAIQQEIVKILDTFTTLEAELEAELEERKKQYEYYRDGLLMFGEDVERKTLGEVFGIKNGYTPSKSKFEYWKNRTVPWFRMEDIRQNGRVLDNSLQHINTSAVKGDRLFPANSILVATSATIGEHALITVPHLSNQRFVSLSVKQQYIDKLIIKYIHYYFYLLDSWCIKNVTISSFASVDMSGFRKFPIPIPPLAEQERIVAILDKFDALVNDISVGLPAELNARRKQYEYYRDKLLDFKPLEKEYAKQ